MLVICFLLVELKSVIVAAADGPETWVNQHPELERIVKEGVKYAIDVFDKGVGDVIDIPDFHYRNNATGKDRREFNGWLGELRKLKSIVRVGGLNVTWIDKDRRTLHFFVRLNLLRIIYNIYNQSNFNFYKEGGIEIQPESNLIRMHVSVVNETTETQRSYAHVIQAELVRFGKHMVHVSRRGEPERPEWLKSENIDELIQPLLETIKPVFLAHVRQGVNTALQRSFISQFYSDFFSKPEARLNGTQYRI